MQVQWTEKSKVSDTRVLLINEPEEECLASLVQLLGNPVISGLDYKWTVLNKSTQKSVNKILESCLSN